MKKYKSHKIQEVIHENDEDLNLHEIKAVTREITNSEESEAAENVC